MSCKTDGEEGTNIEDGCERFCQYLEDCDNIPCQPSDIDLCISNMNNRTDLCREKYIEYADCVQGVGCGDITACTDEYRNAGCL